jgi:hypothetical protein
LYGLEDLHNVAWMESRNFGVTLEIPVVQGEQLWDVMRQHGGYQTRIVDLNTADAVSNHQPSPLGMNPSSTRKQKKFPFNDARARVGFTNRQSEAVLGERTRANIPELHKALCCETDLVSSGRKFPHNGSKHRVIAAVRLDDSQQNIRIQENAHATQS